jgi:hypothetical protein
MRVELGAARAALTLGLGLACDGASAAQRITVAMPIR